MTTVLEQRRTRRQGRDLLERQRNPCQSGHIIRSVGGAEGRTVVSGASRNQPLAQLMAEAGFSYAGLARRTSQLAPAQGPASRTSTTQVARWLAGQVPREGSVDVLVRVFSLRLGRPVSRSDLGLPAPDRPGREGQDAAALRLWRADAAGDEDLAALPFAPQALDRPVMDWLLGTLAAPIPTVRTGLPVTAYEIDRATGLLGMFRELDHAHGAGELRSQVVTYLSSHLAPLLSRPAADPATEMALLRLSASVSEMVGYQAVDTGADGLALRYYLLALGFCSAAGDRAYASHLIAANIAHLTLHQQQPGEALRMVQAAQHGGGGDLSPAARAAFHCVEARAHARLRDEAACSRALVEAERCLERSQPATEPAWMAYFAPADLEDEKAHCMHDLGRAAEAQRIARAAIATLEPTRVRRLAIDTALLATSLADSGQVDEACSVGRAAVDYAARTNSHRTRTRIGQLREALRPYGADRQVQEFDAFVRAALPQAG